MKTKALLSLVLFLSAIVTLAVVQTASAQQAVETIAGPDSAAPGKEATFTLKVADKDGKLLAHSNADIKIKKGDKVAKEDKLHSHTGDATYKYTFAEAGGYVVSVSFSPDEKLATVKYAPVSAEKKVEVK